MSELLKRIEEYSLEEIMGERFGRYCKTIILDRALPDVRDGLNQFKEEYYTACINQVIPMTKSIVKVLRQ